MKKQAWNTTIGVLLLLGLTGWAQTIRTWDGGGNANTSGSWQTGANWSNDTKPAAGEAASLPDVTSGTRTVSNDAPETIHHLRMTQNTATATNVLQLNANLTIASQTTGNNVYLQTLGVGVSNSNLVVNLNGNTINTTVNGWKSHALYGTWDLTASGSQIVSQNGSDSLFVYGQLLMGPNSTITIARNASLPYFENYGTVTFQGNGIAEIGKNVTTGGSGSFVNAIGSTMLVGNGTDTPTARLRYNNVSLNNAAGATTTVNAGATLALYTQRGNTWDTTQAVFDNAGSFTQAGKIVFRPNSWNLEFAGDKDDIDNDGTWTVTGNSAVIERQHSNESQSATYFRFANNATGTLQGNGKLTYTNLTGVVNLNVCNLVNAGTIAPGTSAGTLELVNTNVTFAAGGTLLIELGGTAPGTYDVFTLSGTYGGVLDLSTAGDIFTLAYTDGFTRPRGEIHTWTVVNVASRVGNFDTFNFPDSKFSAAWVGTSLVITSIPEPATGLLLAGLAGLCLRRRRLVQPALPEPAPAQPPECRRLGRLSVDTVH